MVIELAKHELEDVAGVIFVPWPLQWVGGDIISGRGG